MGRFEETFGKKIQLKFVRNVIHFSIVILEITSYFNTVVKINYNERTNYRRRGTADRSDRNWHKH